MAPSRHNIETIPERQSETITEPSNDASILKDLMEEHNYKSQEGSARHIQSYRKSSLRGGYYPVQRKNPHESSVSWECDSQTGCHSRTVSVREERRPTMTAIKSNGQQIYLSADDDELDITSGNEDESHEDAEFEEEKDVALDNYEQLKELYRNCHSSSRGNRYSYLLNCSPYNLQNEHRQSHSHPDPHTPAHHITTNSQTRYFNSLQSAAAHSDGLGDMFHRAPGTVTLILMALLIIAIMLVEMVDVFCYRRRRGLKTTTRRRSRMRAVRIPTVTIYESPVEYEIEKAPCKP